MAQADLDEMMKLARAAHENAKASGGLVDEAAKLVADLAALGAEIGLDAKAT